jgi:hypothetical protein
MTELSSVIEFDEDLNNVEAPKPLPAGQYAATILSAEPMMSKNGEHKMAKVTWSIPAEEYPADYVDGNPAGTQLTQYLMLDNTARAKFALKRFVQAIGAPLSNTVDLTTWLGLAARVEVTNEPFEDTLTARLKKVVG